MGYLVVPIWLGGPKLACIVCGATHLSGLLNWYQWMDYLHIFRRWRMIEKRYHLAGRTLLACPLPSWTALAG